MPRQNCVLATCAALILMVPTVLAQVNTGTISGAVLDPSGRVIAGAQIQASETQTGQTRAAVSNADGYFVFAFLPIGHYKVSATAPGFKSGVHNGLMLSAGRTLSLNLQLEIGAVNQTVTVSSSAAALNTTNAAQIETLQGEDVNRLPLPNKDWTNLLNLDNGVATGGQTGVSMNGLPPASMNVTVDGTNASPDPEVATLGYYQGFDTIHIISSDAISEISVTKGIAPASSGASMEGNINVITKSGTNQFHGSLFETNGNAAYNARNEFLTTKPRYNFNEFGGSLGGPILKDRLFFFGDYEGVRQSDFAHVTGSSPTPEFIARTALVAPEFLPVLAVIPAPNQPYTVTPTTVTGPYSATGAEVHNDLNAVARLDYYLNSNNQITLRYTRSRPFELNPNFIPVNARTFTGHNDIYNAQFTHSGKSWTENTRFGFNRLAENRLDHGYGIGLPQIELAGINSGGGEDFTVQGKIYTWQEDITISRGKHTIEFGGVVQRNGDGRIDDTTTTYKYSSEADFDTNTPSSIAVNFPLSNFWIHTYQFGGYIQDAYRVTPSFTLNAGIRYDYFTVPKEQNHRFYTRDASPQGPGTGALRPPDQLYRADWRNFSPRLGFAWRTGPKGDTVVRSGFGVFFNPRNVFGGPIDDVLDSPYVPFRLTLSRAQALTMGLNYPVDKVALQQQLIAAQAPVATTAIDNDFPNPYSMQWLLDIQQKVGYGFVFDIGYVGSRGMRLLFTETTNLPDRISGVSPYPAFGKFSYYVPSDRTTYHALQTSLKRSFANGLNLDVNYTWSRSFSFGQGDIGLQGAPQDVNNIKADYGPSPFDQPNAFNARFVYLLPIDHWAGLTSRGSRMVVGGWQVSGVFTASSGSPINIGNPNSSYPADRPNRANGVNPYFSDYSQYKPYLNPAAVSIIPIATLSGASTTTGNLSRNAFRNIGQWKLDYSLAKTIPITKRVNFQLQGSFFNGLNHPNLGGLVTSLSKSNFGMFTSASTARNIQIGGRLTF